MTLLKKIWVSKSNEGLVSVLFCFKITLFHVSCIFYFNQKFKRLRRIQDEESDGEEGGDESQDRDAIAMNLFSDDVSLISYLM